MTTEVIASSIAGILFVTLLLTLLLKKRRETEPQVYEQREEPLNQTNNGLPSSKIGPPVSIDSNSSTTHHEKLLVEIETPPGGPKLPPEGLPPDWTSEQWQYYGQQYIDTKQ